MWPVFLGLLLVASVLTWTLTWAVVEFGSVDRGLVVGLLLLMLPPGAIVPL